MKRFLSAGEGYALFPTNINYRMPRNFPGLRASILYTIGLFMCLQAGAMESAPTPTDRAVPVASNLTIPLYIDSLHILDIGDEVPEAIWNTPLTLWSREKNASEVVTLNDYRGKVIVLDFWSTYCTVCIVNMPKMFGLQNALGDRVAILPITYQEEGLIAGFLGNPRYQALKNINTRSIVGDSTIHRAFPSQSLPHIVIIDNWGRVSAMTQAAYINAENLAALYGGEQETYFPRYKKYHHDQFLDISPAYKETNRLNGPNYYAALTGFLDGVGHAMYWGADDSGLANRLYISNIFLLKLYATALGSPLPITPKRFILEVDDPEKYHFIPEKHFSDADHYRKNFWTYESILPKHVDEKTAYNKMWQDLNLLLGVYGRIEPRLQFCWVIRRTADFRDTLERGISLASLVTLPFNEDQNMPLVIDDTGDRFRKTGIHEPLPLGLSIGEYNQLLKPHGYQLIAENRVIDMFVLTEINQKEGARK